MVKKPQASREKRKKHAQGISNNANRNIKAEEMLKVMQRKEKRGCLVLRLLVHNGLVLGVGKLVLSNLARSRSNLHFLHAPITLTASTRALPIRRVALEHHATGCAQHLGVRADTVALLGWDLVAILMLVVLLGGPGEVVTADLDVIVGELAELVVIHTEELGFLGGAQVKARDGVDAVGDDGGHDKGISGGCNDIGDLNVQLLVVVNDPATDTGTGVDAVQADNGVVTEESVEDQTDDSGNAVLG